MPELTLADIQEQMAGVETEPLVRGAVVGSDISRTRDLKVRRLIEAERGAAYTDFEWNEARRNLSEFFGILAEWRESDENAIRG